MEAIRKKSYEVDMTEGPLFRKLLAFAIPLMLSGILQCLYNAADIVVIGRFVGDEPLAAVGATGSLISLVTNLFIGLSIGTSITVSTAIGARNEGRIHRLVHTSVALSLVCGAIAMAVGMSGAYTFLQWMDTPDNILDMATEYMQIYFAGSLFSMFYNFGAAVLRAAGDTRRPLYFLMLSGLVNVVLNLFFVIVCGMDVDGVAYATIISQALSAILVFIALLRYPGACRFSCRQLRFHARETWDIVRTGLPAGIQSVVFSFSNIIIQSAINSFDSFAVAGNTAASNLDGLNYTAMNALSTTAVTAIGQNVGAGKMKRITPVLLQCLLIVTIVGLTFGGCIFLFGEQLLHIYLPDSPESVQYGLIRISILGLTYVFCGWMETACGVGRGMGSTVAPMLASILGVVGIRLVWIYTIFAMPEYHTLEMLYWSYPLSWLVTFATHLVLFGIIRHRLVRAHEAHAAAQGAEAAAPAV